MQGLVVLYTMCFSAIDVQVEVLKHTAKGQAISFHRWRVPRVLKHSNRLINGSHLAIQRIHELLQVWNHLKAVAGLEGLEEAGSGPQTGVLCNNVAPYRSIIHPSRGPGRVCDRPITQKQEFIYVFK